MPTDAPLAPPPRVRHRRGGAWRLLVGPLALAAAVTVGVGCGDDDPDPGHTAQVTTTRPPRTTTTTAPAKTTTSKPASPEEEVKAAYLAAVEVLNEAFATSNPDLPGLAETHADPSLSSLRATLRSRRELGQVARYPGGVPPRQQVRGVRLVDATDAVLTVCVIDNSALVVEASGAVVDGDVVSHLNEVMFSRNTGQWLITNVRSLGTRPGDSGCDHV